MQTIVPMKSKIYLTPLFIMATALFALFACNDIQQIREVVQQADTESPVQKVSSDCDGMYVGTLPCPDCGGIYTEIVLSGSKYKTKEIYPAKGYERENIFADEGEYTWDKDNKIITLSGHVAERFEVGEDVLYAIDVDGKRITGHLENMYVLHKK